MKWVEIQIKTSKEAVDAVSNILYDVGADGVVIEDNDIDIAGFDWDYVDEDVLENIQDNMVTTVKGYLVQSPSLHDKISLIKEKVNRLPEYNLDKGPGKVETIEVDDEEWSNWKKYYKPMKIGPEIVVKPKWENYIPQEGEKVVELDPGMAFGTGTHETTYMCINALQKYMKAGMDIIDVGCGSGILAITAAKLGANHVLALDKDDVAVKVAEENIKLNHVEDIVTVKKNNLLEGIELEANLIIANIVADAIIRLMPAVEKNLKDGGLFVTSGIIKERQDDVMNYVYKGNLSLKERMEMGEWVTLVLNK
ncbi:MAG: 50S ribosomal protein L11 methyltransferase [Thermoanaerobacteraceae bacterium]|nr:50S ribosomal protein L11 methyltransferase [Thermoanaerobacteraceae bacterium]